MKLIMILIATIMMGTEVKAAVWADVNQWSQDWEARYSSWVKNEWNKYFFSRRLLPNGQSNP